MVARFGVWLIMFAVVGFVGCSNDDPSNDPDTNDTTDLGDVGGDGSGDAADGNDTGDGGSTDDVMRGVAATGAPITSASVDIKCQDNTASQTTTTSANGSYQVTIAAGSGPCALKVDVGGVTLYSFSATGNGTANITPLTDLILSLALDSAGKGTADAWFNGTTDWSGVMVEVEASLADLQDALSAAGFVLPSTIFDPMTALFNAQAGDAWDDLLEAIAQAIEDDATVADYAALRSNFVAGTPLPTAPGSVGIPTPTGDGAALNGKSGVTATINGNTITFLQDDIVENVSFGAANPARTLFTFQAFATNGDNIDPLTFWKVVAVPKEVGVHQCRTQDGSLPLVRLGNGGFGADASKCLIEVLEIEETSVKGRFSAVFGDDVVTDGYFVMLADTGGGEALPAGEVGVSFVVDGTTYRYPLSNYLGFETFNGMDGRPTSQSSPGHPVGIQLHTIPDAVGTYACDQAFEGNQWRKVNVWFYWNGAFYYAGTRQNPSPGAEGSSCTITVTSAGTTFEGTFSGTFVGESGAIVVTDGLFRHIRE